MTFVFGLSSALTGSTGGVFSARVMMTISIWRGLARVGSLAMHVSAGIGAVMMPVISLVTDDAPLMWMCVVSLMGVILAVVCPRAWDSPEPRPLSPAWSWSPSTCWKRLCARRAGQAYGAQVRARAREEMSLPVPARRGATKAMPFTYLESAPTPVASQTMTLPPVTAVGLRLRR